MIDWSPVVIRPLFICFQLLTSAYAFTASDVDLDSAIAKNRQGVLVIKTDAGAKVAVEQIRHEFWFGATLPGSIFTGQASPEDIAKFKETFTTLFNAGVIEAAFKWHDMERERGHVNYSIVDSMLAWADSAFYHAWRLAESLRVASGNQPAAS